MMPLVTLSYVVASQDAVELPCEPSRLSGLGLERTSFKCLEGHGTPRVTGEQSQLLKQMYKGCCEAKCGGTLDTTMSFLNVLRECQDMRT